MNNRIEIGIPAIRLMAMCLLFATSLMVYGQSNGHFVTTGTVAEGAMTIGTLSTYESVQACKAASVPPGALDAGLLAFCTLNNDIGMAHSFFSEQIRTLHSDEVECGEMWFGRALACRSDDETVFVATVVTQPISVVYRHWLEQISRDYIKLREISQDDKVDPEFVRSMEQAFHDTSDESAVWVRLKTGYCNEVPSGAYPDIDGKMQNCGGQSTAQQLAAPSSHDSATSSQLNGVSARTATLATSYPPSVTTLASTQANKIAKEPAGACEKNVSFAVVEDAQVESRVPRFAQKWIEKNKKKYPALCFSQTPDPQAANFLLVFSTSQSAFNGIYPTVHTNSSSGTTPVNGNGTVTDSYGGMWNYTYNGTVTTTTTTTSQVSLPYTDTTKSLYVYSYDQRGQLLSRHRRSITTRQGGDGANTFGYNLGAALSAIHLKEHLLKAALNDLAK